MPLPHFFLVGAPQAGTRTLRSLLDRHPEVSFPAPPAPSYFVCDDERPSGRAHRGPGDLQRARRWVWERARYEKFFERPPAGVLRGDDTPYLLHDLAAHHRIRRSCPEARLVVLLRDPVERAHVHWMRLRSDGLEPVADFVEACRAEERRAALGWSSRWCHVGLSKYGEQLEHLYSVFSRDQVLVLRYRQLVAEPQATLDQVSRFLGITAGLVRAPSSADSQRLVPDTPASQVLGTAVRAGAWLGGHTSPSAWQLASAPFRAVLRASTRPAPELPPADRVEVIELLVDDIRLAEDVTGETYREWLSDVRIPPSAWRSLVPAP